MRRRLPLLAVAEYSADEIDDHDRAVLARRAPQLIAEQQRLRQTEHTHAILNEISDFVIYRIQSESNPLRVAEQVLHAAQARFGHRISPDLIFRLVAATIIKDEVDREKAAAIRVVKRPIS